MLTVLFLAYLSFVSHFFGELYIVDYVGASAVALIEFVKFSLELQYDEAKNKAIKKFSFSSKKSN
jgi:hypothetical protein